MRRLAVLTVALLIVCGCRDSAYNTASKADTTQAWRHFLSANPKDPNVDSAQQRLEELELTEAKKTHSVVAYKRFLDEFPQSDQAASVRALLETLRFNGVAEKPSAPAWRGFLREHPDGPHHEAAEKALGVLELAEVSTLSDAAQLTRMAAENPNDPRSAEATAQLDELEWSKASSAAKTYAYLREHPAGAHRDEAKVRLLSLQLEGQLVSGLVDQAAALAKKNPLSNKVPQLEARIQRAKAVRALSTAQDERVQRALPTYFLRSFDDVEKSIQSPDPMDRWDAAQELGFFISVKTIDPLLEAFRTARSPIVRQKAFESLSLVLQSLPHEVAEYEVATRVEALRSSASEAQLYLSTAVLLDLTGQLQLASTEYQRAWDAKSPDPVVLRRWASLRRERRQFFSAAVAARQLAVWALDQAQNAMVVGVANPITTARELCAVSEAAIFADSIIDEAKGQKTEFPEDLEVFSLRAKEAVRLSSARLRDAELAMLGEKPSARKCGDDSVRSRFDASVIQRLAGSLRARLSSWAGRTSTTSICPPSGSAWRSLLVRSPYTHAICSVRPSSPLPSARSAASRSRPKFPHRMRFTNHWRSNTRIAPGCT